MSGLPEVPVRVLVLQGERARRESIEADLRARGCEIIALDSAMAALDGASRSVSAPPTAEPASAGPLAADAEAPLADLPYAKARELALRRFEQAYVEAQLRASSDNISAAARRAGMDRSNFKRLLRKHRRALNRELPIDDDLAIG